MYVPCYELFHAFILFSLLSPLLSIHCVDRCGNKSREEVRDQVEELLGPRAKGKVDKREERKGEETGGSLGSGRELTREH